MDYKDKDIDTQRKVADFRQAIMEFIEGGSGPEYAEVVIAELSKVIQSLPPEATYSMLGDRQLSWIGAQMMLCVDETMRNKGEDIPDNIRDELIKTQRAAEDGYVEDNEPDIKPSPGSFPAGGYFGGQRGGDA